MQNYINWIEKVAKVLQQENGGIGVVIMDHKAFIMRAATLKLNQANNSIMAKFVAVLKALEFAQEMRFRHTILEGDAT
ncbi:hypothetical protein PVK06_017048 [Gossypium arboreum]|uniref:RNase H type-1 domain-containing protein n=1 Tax=Gossypium arboreum TaxID=29729 RepID=A0ABR0Q1P0_GOSAR|nr:hypothetical protein PVK06_017048 [Gossypium arboreum]